MQTEVSPPLSPEMEALRLAALVALRSVEREPLERLLDTSVDRSRLLENARAHGLVPLLHRALDSAGVDPAIREEFAGRAAEIARRNLWLVGGLLEIIQPLENAGCRPAAFKGPVLASALYGNIARREYSDIDILIAPSRAREAREALEALGFEPRNFPENAKLRSLSHEDRLERPDGLAVELHVRLAPRWWPVPLDLEELTKSRETHEIAGRAIPVLGDDDNLLALAVHGARHQWSRLEWILGIAEHLRRRPPCDPTALLVRARAAGCLRILILPALLARDLFDVPLPPEWETLVQADRRLEDLARKVLVNLESSPGAPPASFDHAAFAFGVRERLRERLTYLRYRLVRLKHESGRLAPLAWARKYGLGRVVRNVLGR